MAGGDREQDVEEETRNQMMQNLFGNQSEDEDADDDVVEVVDDDDQLPPPQRLHQDEADEEENFYDQPPPQNLFGDQSEDEDADDGVVEVVDDDDQPPPPQLLHQDEADEEEDFDEEDDDARSHAHGRGSGYHSVSSASLPPISCSSPVTLIPPRCVMCPSLSMGYGLGFGIGWVWLEPRDWGCCVLREVLGSYRFARILQNRTWDVGVALQYDFGVVWLGRDSWTMRCVCLIFALLIQFKPSIRQFNLN
jgi:hypothetical protein